MAFIKLDEFTLLQAEESFCLHMNWRSNISFKAQRLDDVQRCEGDLRICRKRC
jgi:hypothetical protein